MSKKSHIEAGLPESHFRMLVPALKSDESMSREASYIVAPGDILRLERSNGYCKRGKYAILALDMTVCLALTKKKAKQRRITNRLVYIQITDLCHFKRTKKHLENLPSLTSARKNGRRKLLI